MKQIYSPENGYNLGAALATAKIVEKSEPTADPQRAAEFAYLLAFARGDFASEITYGYGRPTKAEHGRIVDASNVSQAQLAKHAARFGTEGTEGLQRPASDEKVLSRVAARRASKRGLTKRQKMTNLLGNG